MKANLRDLAVELYDIGAIKYGSFITKAGIQTPIYIDLRAIFAYPSLLLRLSNTLWSLANDKDFKHLCGVPYTALPIATVISAESNIPMLVKRKEAKSYGTKKLIEGIFEAGDTALIIEDVITSGGSIIETVNELKKEGLIATTALVIVDREQGGNENLKNAGITVKSLFTITDLIGHLHEAGKLSEESVRIVKDYISAVQAPLKVKDENDRLKNSFTVRAKLATNPVANKLFKMMSEKQTTLCLATDYTKGQDIIDLVILVGSHIAVLKIHVDIIEDFDKHFILKLKEYAHKFNLLIMEDRKFADIGQTVSYQYRRGVYNIVSWADLVTAHPVPGSGMIQGLTDSLNEIAEDRGIFIVAEMSSSGALTTRDYVKSAVSNFKNFDLVAGFVCQSNVFSDPGLIQLTEGVKLTKSTDNLDQQYNTPHDIVDSGADLVVVGREITYAKDILASVLEYKKVFWEAYENRIKQ